MFPIIDRRKTGQNLKILMDQRAITAKDVQEYLELASVQSVYRWLNGKSMPTIDHLYALKELLKVSVDEMICGN